MRRFRIRRRAYIRHVLWGSMRGTQVGSDDDRFYSTLRQWFPSGVRYR